MIAFNLRLAVRSMRWVAPSLILLTWIALTVSNPGPTLANAGGMFFVVVAVTCWLTIAIGNVDDDGHRELLAAAAGSPARLHRIRAVAALAASNLLSVLGTVACLVAATPPTRPTSELVGIGACLLMQLSGTELGVAIGTLLHRPVMRHAGFTVLLAIAAILGLIPLPPVQSVLRALDHGRTTGVLLLAALSTVVALAATTGAATLAGRRN